MIYIDMNGRCGNQLFQYAFARKLMSLAPSQSLRINFYNVEKWRLKTKDDTFSDQLRHFNVLPYISCIKQEDALTEYGSTKQRRAFKNYQLKRKIAYRLHCKKIYKLALRSLNKRNVFREDECKDNVILPVKTDDIFVKGYFENKRYFDDIRDILLKEFTPKNPAPEKNKNLYDIINKRESVCVSFRRWSEVSADVARERDVCGKEYYEKAIEKMHELFPNCVFVVFSNDIEWVKSNFEFKYETVFEDGTDEVWEKLRLMYSCKHFIMSTSTFCWWAQYLSRSENKTVIAPNRWTNDDNKQSKLLLNEWIKI